MRKSAAFVASIVVLGLASAGAARSECNSTPCQAADHTPTDNWGHAAPNDCKSGTKNYPDEYEPTSWTLQQMCGQGGSWKYKSWSQTLTNIQHDNNNCINTGAAPCAPCSVPTGGIKICPQLRTCAGKRYHEVWDMYGSLVYAHHWLAVPGTTVENCNCSRHGCNGTGPPPP